MISIMLFKQIVVLFMMMGLGLLIVKCKLLKCEDSRVLSVITVYLIIPCTIINAFQIGYSDEIRDGFILALAAAVLIHAVLLTLTGIMSPFFRFSQVEKASIIYSNAGNLIIPLVTSVLGSSWVIYTSAFICFQTLVLWTHGVSLMEGRSAFDVKKMLSNVNILACFVGIALFMSGVRLPYVVSSVLSSMASLLGPVCMVMLGMLFAGVSWKKVFFGRRIYVITFIKMILLPLMILLLLRFSGLSAFVPEGRTILLICLLAVTTPSATIVTQMAQLHGHDAVYASVINVMTTVVCIITMPLMVYLYML